MAGLVIAVRSGRPLPAQGTPYTATSPLRPCCASSNATMQAVRDTAPSILRASRNAAGVRTALGEQWRRVVVMADGTRGEWRRPQEAAAHEALSLVAEGAQRAGSWLTTGVAQYHRAVQSGVSWNNSSDAYLGSSYVWADSVGGTVRRDALALSGAVITPVWRHLTAALQVDYALGQGARRNDPRPLFRRRVAELSPALSLTMGRQTIGLGAMVGWHREDQEIGGGTSTEFPVVFRLRGIGTFDRTQLISAERAVLGGVVGAHAAWARAGERWQWSLGSTLRVERDSVRDGISTPVTNGATRRVRLEGTTAVRRRSDRGGIDWRTSLRSEDAQGRDPVFSAINAIDDATTLHSDVQWWRGDSPQDARWSVALTVEQATLSRRDVATETEWRATVPGISALAGHRFAGGARALAIAVGGGVQRPTTTSYEALRPSRMTPVLALADYAVVSAPRAHGSLALAWETRADGMVTRRLRLETTVHQTTGTLADARRSLGRTQWMVGYEVY
jgi:hypothetical protein